MSTIVSVFNSEMVRCQDQEMLTVHNLQIAGTLGYLLCVFGMQRTENQSVVPKSSRAVAGYGSGQTNEKILAPKGRCILLWC